MTVSPQNTDMTTISQGVEFQSAGSLPLIGSPKYCPGVKGNGGGYLCETGHCCGETGCCTYYYELWWFWLLWTVLIMFSCCCAYRHRRAKLRIQQQQRQREINLIAYHGACNYPTSMLDLSFLASFKLPSYEEVAAQPSTPPPPYSSVFAVQGGGGLYAHAGPSGLTSSQSSDNYTSCSCESCSATSPCSTSFSAQVTYETDTSNATTPSEASDFQPLGSAPAPVAGSPAPASESLAPPAGSPTLPQPPPPPAPAPAPLPPPAPSAPALPLADPPVDSTEGGDPHVDESPSPKPTLSPPKHALFSPNVDFFEPEGRSPCASDADEEDVDADESQYRHRRLTGDSGIEVCRCQVESEEEEEEEEEGEKGEGAGRSKAQAEGEGPRALHDSADCSGRAQARVSETRASEERAGLCGPAPGPAPCGPTPLKEEAVITVESA